MDKESLIKYLEYISAVCTKELGGDTDLEDVSAKKEFKILQSKVETLGFSSEITSRVLSLNAEETLSAEDETRFLYGLIPRAWPYRDEEKRKRGLIHLRGKIDHLIFEIKTEG